MSTAESSPPGTVDVGDTSETLFKRESENDCRSDENYDVDSLDDSRTCSRKNVSLLPDAGAVDSERRTRYWITQFSKPSLSQGDVTDVASETSRLREAVTSPSNIMTDQSVTWDSVPITGIAVDMGQSEVASENTTRTHNARTQVRSRFGRLVKPVNRLIQSMSRQDVVRDNFSVKSVCKPILHLLVE